VFSTIALTLALQVQPNWLVIGDAQSRCSLEGCVAQVSVGDPVAQLAENTTRKQTSLFYEEDQFYLHYELRKRIRNFLDSHPTHDRFIVTGFTDGCGDHSYNRQLSRKRANEVARYIMSIRQGALVELEWKGEATGKHTIRARRVDVAVLKKTQQTITPPKIIYDYYLIDASGSMAGGKWIKWTNAIAYWKPKRARVFVAYTGYIPYGARLDRISPSGGTEIYFALWTLLDRMKPGQTLVVISDFRASVALSGREYQRIEQKIRDKQVKVSHVRL
jgi:outer membrane protein OmpA-like peptidoglycan-associated protein